MKITGNEPYFPFMTHNENGIGNSFSVHSEGGKQYFEYEQGITIRQQFAAMAMAGFLADSATTEPLPILATKSVQAADLLIAELNKEKS